MPVAAFCGLISLLAIVAFAQCGSSPERAPDTSDNSREPEPPAEPHEHMDDTSILERISDAFYALDPDWRFSRINRKAERLLRKPRNLLLGRRIWEEFPGLAGSAFDREIHRARAAGESAEFEDYFPEADRWFEIHAFPEAGGVSVYFRDITGRKRTEEELLARINQQAAVASLSQLALQAPDLDKLFKEAVSILAATLDVEFTKILRLLPEENKLLLIAGYGWDEGYVGREKVTAGPESHIGYTLLTSEPVIMEDLRTEKRFGGTALLHNHKVISGVTIIIDGHDGPFGVIGIHSTRKRTFTGDDVNFLRSVANVLATAIERKRIEDESLRLANHVRLLLESAGEGIYGIDVNGICTFVNPAAARLLGYDAEELLGRDMHATIHHSLDSGERYSEKECPVHRAIRSGRGCRVEDEPLWRRDGTSFPASYSSFPIIENGEVQGAVVTFVDISERKKAEEEINESRERLARIVETNADGIAIIGRDGRFSFANPAAEKIMGMPAYEITRRTHDDPAWKITSPEGEPIPYEELPLSTVMRTGRPVYGIEIGLERADGRRITVSINAAPLRDSRGRITGMVSSLRDITRQKHIEAERRNLLEREQSAREAAEEASRTKDEFLATVSHELRTPLTAILGWSQLLRSGRLDQTMLSQAYDTIERNARAQTQLIEDILDVSRIIRGKLRLEIGEVDLSNVIRAAIESVRPAASAKSIRISAELDQQPGLVLGDPNRLQQVVWNLLSNSIKFTPTGGRVDVKLARTPENISIAVSDTGTGISREFLPHVFDRFRQADSSYTREQGGLGLGLAIVRHLVEMHGGTVEARSNGKNQGSSFIVTLPAAAPEMAEQENYEPAGSDERRQRRQSPGQLECARDLSGLKVLIVDDEPDARNLLRLMVSRCGAEVALSSSAREAFKMVQEWKPDVLVSDIGMPGEDGIHLISRVRKLSPDKGGRIPALALTGYARIEDRMRVLSAGFQMHVVKPVEPAELIQGIAMLAHLEESGNPTPASGEADHATP